MSKKNESKDLINETSNRDLAVENMKQCEEEKIKGKNGKNVAVNLTTEVNRTLTGQKACLDKNSISFNFPKVSYTTILKEPIRTVRPISAPIYVPPQVSASLNVGGSSHDLTKGVTHYWKFFNH